MTTYEAISIVVALIALAQPWLIAGWKRWIRPGTVETYKTGRLEVGFSSFGPTVALHGTLRATSRDVFVCAMSVDVVRELDRATCSFEWAAFRSHQIGGSPETPTFELPHSFNVLEAQPARYNVVFRIPSAEREVSSLLAEVQDKWDRQPINEERRQILAARGNIGLAFGRKADEAFEEFLRSDVVRNAFGKLKCRSYWEAGAYLLTLRVHTKDRKRRSSSRTWSFELSAQDANRLRRNAVVMLYAACDRPREGSYGFAYPEYREASAPNPDEAPVCQGQDVPGGDRSGQE